MKYSSCMQNSKLRIACSFLLLFFCLTCNAFAADKTIGVIMTGDIPYYSDVHDAFIAALNGKGYAGKVATLIQKPYPDSISLSNAARKLIAHDVDVIVAYGAPAVEAVAREKSGIPIIYTCMYEPCKFPGVKSITGTCSRPLVSNLLRYLKSLTAFSSLGVIYNSNEDDSLYQMQEMNRLSGRLGYKIEEIDIKRPQDIKQKLQEKNMDAIIIASSSAAGIAFPSIIEFSIEHRIPTASLLSDKNHYAIITLAPAPGEQGEKTAEKVIRIFNGADPKSIKADISNETELVFNLKDASSMGLRIPMELVTEATRLIK
jgi:putative ABC transport system substrate-binding protein